MNRTLRQLYDASEEDMTYGIGVMDLGTGIPSPIVCIHYKEWSREQLELVRESFHDGIVLTTAEKLPGVHHVHLATRETMSFQHVEGGQTAVLRAPAWDADLGEVDEVAFQIFEANRQVRGGFLVLLQSAEWEFLVAVDDRFDGIEVGPIQPRSLPTPQNDHPEFGCDALNS